MKTTVFVYWNIYPITSVEVIQCDVTKKKDSSETCDIFALIKTQFLMITFKQIFHQV